MTALKSYFSMLSEQHGFKNFVLITDNAASQKQRRQEYRYTRSSSTDDLMNLKFSGGSPQDDKCPSRPRRTSDSDLYYYLDGDEASEKHFHKLPTNTTKAAAARSSFSSSSDEEDDNLKDLQEQMNVWSLNQSHFQYSRMMSKNKRPDHRLSAGSNDDPSTSPPSSLIPRVNRWKF